MNNRSSSSLEIHIHRPSRIVFNKPAVFSSPIQVGVSQEACISIGLHLAGAHLTGSNLVGMYLTEVHLN
jgi:hypothetical protein